MLVLYTYPYLGTPTKPTIAALPGQQIELINDNATLLMKCLSYDTNFTYKWQKKNGRLPIRAQGVNTEELIITKLGPEDSGEYQCIVSNSTGMIASDYLLLIIRGLLFIV